MIDVPDVPASPAPQSSPRGVERVKRRAAQAAAKVTEQAEAATLTSPKSPEKTAQIAANKRKDVARFGPTAKTRREARQAEHKAQSEREAITLAGAPVTPLIGLVPGQQVDHRTARLLAKMHDQEERDTNREAAQAAGLAVLNTLKGRPQRDKHTRFRRIANHTARQAKLAGAV